MTQRLCDVTPAIAGEFPSCCSQRGEKNTQPTIFFTIGDTFSLRRQPSRGTHCRQNAAGEQSETKTMPAFPPGRPSRRSKGDGGLHARRRVTRHRQRLTVSSQAAASSFSERPKPPPPPPKGEGGPRRSARRRGNRWGSLLHHKLREVEPAPTRGRPAAGAQAPAAAACRGVFTFPSARQVQPDGGGTAATPLQDRRRT